MLEDVYTGKDMTNEEFLLRLIKGAADKLDASANGVENNCPFADGEVCGLSYAVELIQKAVLLYNKKCSGELSIT
jgi:hypothetical protein